MKKVGLHTYGTYEIDIRHQQVNKTPEEKRNDWAKEELKKSIGDVTESLAYCGEEK
jgi:hypothetical protein